MLLRLAITASLALGLTLARPAAPKKRTTKKPVATRRTTTPKPTTPKPTPKKRRATAKRSVPKPPPVSAKTRQSAVEFVNSSMDAAAAAAVENSAALVPFFEQLYQREQQQPTNLHILHYGDSHSASDDWAHQIRSLFQTRFGNGGAGYSLAGRPFLGYRRYDVKSSQSQRWETEGLLTKGTDGHYGLAGTSIVTQNAGEYAHLDADGQKVELYYLQQPGGGSFRVYIDGVETATINTDGPLQPGYWSHTVPDTPRRYTVETMTFAPVKLFGWVTERDRGITWETLGINGAQANISLRWEEAQLQDHITKRNPALIVFAYGTNEATNRDWTPESYRAMFREVLTRFRRMAPAASFLVVGPPDRAIRQRRAILSVPKLDMITEAQREVALELGCAFWDLRERMGGDGAIKRWVSAGFAQGDFVHLTGQGYRLVGETLYRDLIAHYEEFRRIRQKVFTEGTNNNDNANRNY